MVVAGVAVMMMMMHRKKRKNKYNYEKGETLGPSVLGEQCSPSVLGLAKGHTWTQPYSRDVPVLS